MRDFIFKQKVFLISFVAILVISIGSFIFPGKFHLIKRLDTISSNSNPLIRHFSPTWRSIKKITGIPFLIVGALHPNQLSTYEIRLSKNDRLHLLENLPNFPHETKLFEKFKNPVKADFRYGGYTTKDAKIRYRGLTSAHWNALKKSLQINLPKNNPLGDQTTLRFFLPEDRGWAQIFLWSAIQKKLGLITLDVKPAWLTVNAKSMGLYTLSEGFEETLLEKNKRVKNSIFSDLNEKTRPDNYDLFMPGGIKLWYDRFSIMSSPVEFSPLRYLLFLTAETPDTIFKKEIESVLNMDYFLRWTFFALLSGNFHPGNNQENMNLYFNPAIGKFEPISLDANITPLNSPIDLSPPHMPINRLVNRILFQDEFRVRLEKIAGIYVNNQTNIAEDLATYDAAAAAILPAIFRDTQKLPTSWSAWRDIQNNRKLFQQNVSTIQTMIKKGEFRFRYAKETYPLTAHTLPYVDEFASFRAISASRNEFLAAYPQFVAGAHPQTIILLPGTHTFSRNIIIPRNLHLIIRENATLLFAPNISFVSYGPVIARGYAEAPIVMRPLIANTSWGVFALINTNGKNVFTHTHIQGGKDATINGIYFSGMLSAHNADLEFHYGTVENAGADDGIHILSGEAIITDSLFHNNSSDGIDIDFAEGESFFERNLFTATGGDAMDLSFSKIKIRENTVRKCGDKGISAGEASTPLIEHNTIEGCVYGIAVKDRSEATIANNILENNETAIGLYRKKPHFIYGGVALLKENIFNGNDQNMSVDTYSSIK